MTLIHPGTGYPWGDVPDDDRMTSTERAEILREKPGHEDEPLPPEILAALMPKAPRP